MSELRANNIFIWAKGDLESYYSDKVIMMPGSKDVKALELSYLLQDPDQDIEDLFVNTDEIAELVELILPDKVLL